MSVPRPAILVAMVTARDTGLGHDFGFLLVIAGIQHLVLDAFVRQEAGQLLGLFNRDRTDQRRPFSWLAISLTMAMNFASSVR